MIESITFYDNTGQILYTLSGSASYLADCADRHPELSFVQGQFSGDQYYIVAGQPVNIPAPPHSAMMFNHSTGEWVENDLADTARIASIVVNATTSNRILKNLPDWKQRNLTAQAAAMLYQILKRANLCTAEEITLLDSLFAKWQSVEEKRAESNDTNAAINNAVSVAEIESIKNDYLAL